jgi:SAM-dependent methyltransferase
MNAGEHIVAALDSLGIARAHFGYGAFGTDMGQVAAARPGMVASVLSVLATPLSASLLRGQRPMVAVLGRQGLHLIVQAGREIRELPGVDKVELPADYEALAWSDPVTDHTAAIRDAASRLAEAVSLPAAALPPGERDLGGVAAWVDGVGPPLVLLPSGLWPTQWDAAVAELARSFTVIRLGGPNIGSVASLEQRAAYPGYVQMVDLLFDRLAIADGDRILEVGPGPGALVRQLARRVRGRNSITAVDISPYFLREAQFLASRAGLETPITWQQASAETLPFDDNSFDVAYSVTALEECNADRAIAEVHRVVRPGGRAGVIVRAIDAPLFWNIDVPDIIASALAAGPFGAVSAEGCADRSLYARFARHFTSITPWAHWGSMSPLDPSAMSGPLAGLDRAHHDTFLAAVAEANAAGTGFASFPFHCVVGTKP